MPPPSATASSPRAAATAARRSQILDAALACIADKGIEATTIEDIRDRSRASIGSIYHHFGDKDQLIGAVFAAALIEYTNGFLAALERSRSARTGLERAVEFHIGWFDDRPVLADLMFRTLYTERRQPHELRPHFVAFDARLNAWLERHQTRGELRRLHPDVYAATIFGPCIELSRLRMGGYSDQDQREAARQLAGVIWQGLRLVSP
jgi:AcrR family transcriptional regulator